MTDIERIEELLALELAKRSFTADFNGAVAILSALRAMPLDLRLALADELVPWEPIENAKKDGTRYLLLRAPVGDDPSGATLGYWDAPEHGEYLGDCGGECRCPEYGEPPAPMWWSEDGGFTEEHPPAGFKPLPTAPQQKDEPNG